MKILLIKKVSNGFRAKQYTVYMKIKTLPEWIYETKKCFKENRFYNLKSKILYHKSSLKSKKWYKMQWVNELVKFLKQYKISVNVHKKFKIVSVLIYWF